MNAIYFESATVIEMRNNTILFKQMKMKRSRHCDLNPRGRELNETNDVITERINVLRVTTMCASITF